MVEDRLLSDHIVPAAELDPLPVAAADRRDFATILTTTENEIVLSRARRDEEGRLLGRSTLLLQVPAGDTYMPRNRAPAHAFSETDRLTARPDEFHGLPQARAASDCWFDWLRPEITPHDGAVRPDHPAVLAILERTQSASSLRMLLRNPLGFVWRYGLRWRAPDSGEEPLVLEALSMGDLVHRTLNRALQVLEADGGVAGASEKRIAAAVNAAAAGTATSWEAEQAVPPPVIWRRTLDEVRELGCLALAFREEDLAGARAHGEVPFGGSEPKTDGAIPWDAEAPVEIPGAGFHISGYIDRLDISADDGHALVRDYKTGRAPKNDIVLDGGRELQRCLYAFAVRALLGDHVSIAASLLYPRENRDLRLDDPDAALRTLTRHLQAARTNLASGGAVMGRDTGGDRDDLAFALPANAAAFYRVRKEAAANARLGDATRVWDAP
ncbi:MAG: PD-(D/E)XK nuclease family protein [Rhodospirillales bacterium]|nr:PD-(D/E)XK nuclease family protein [Rhodospirillales bacterium]